jgi:hypothetical protein
MSLGEPYLNLSSGLEQIVDIFVSPCSKTSRPYKSSSSPNSLHDEDSQARSSYWRLVFLLHVPRILQQVAFWQIKLQF